LSGGADCVRVEHLEDDALWRVFLATPKANILDDAMIHRLTEVFEEAGESKSVKSVLIEGDGPNFSFGASVAEHLPGVVEGMLPRFHRMFRTMLKNDVHFTAVVRGQCLGGGLELASFCHRVLTSPDARFGQPEIVLGVFAPVASLMLVERVGRARAEDLCISGRIIGAEEACAIGLVDKVTDEPEKAAVSYAQEFLLPRSASSLRFAVGAVRGDFRAHFEERIDRLEKLYLEGLMSTRDAEEGLRAFLEKRSPQWSNA
jgi:cyclohexa-1,5-dienecarbonyl-CoA hydratase